MMTCIVERLSLSAAVSIHRMPVEVKVVSVSDDPEFEDNSYSPAGEELRLVGTEETPFLRANSIMDGQIYYSYILGYTTMFNLYY